MSFLEGLAGGIGEALEPVAPALDFLGLGQQGFAPPPTSQDVWGQLGGALKEAALAGPAGLAVGATDFIRGIGDMSNRDRLLYGGLLLAGAAGAARYAYQRFKMPAFHPPGNLTPRMIPSGVAESQGLGIARSFTDLSAEAAQLQLDRPGVRGRTAQILAPEDNLGAARAMASFTADDLDPRIAGMASLLDGYGEVHPGGMGEARVDWARFDYAVDNRLLSYDHNKPIRDAYNKFREGGPLTDAEQQELVTGVQALGDATRGSIVADDLSVGLTARVTNVDIVDGKAVLHVTARTPEGGDLFSDKAYREQAITTLNAGFYQRQGQANIRQVWDLGIDDARIRAHGLGEPRLPKQLELGADWYWRGRQDIANAFGIGLDSPELPRAVAATSLLSEAENWATNVPKAQKVANQFFTNPKVLDNDFQNWLRSGTKADFRDDKTLRTYAGRRAKAHQKTFDVLHADAKAAGIKASASDLKKALRLMSESPEQLWLSTVATKQKNFYLNLLNPDLEYPTTIDRHAFDIYYGLDMGVDDRPIDMGDNYDIIADAYRRVAADLSEELDRKILPHQVQAVTWEVWRMMKRAHNGGWYPTGKHPGMDPFRLRPGPGIENPVFDALQGKGGTEVFASLFGGRDAVLPVPALENTGSGVSAVLMPDGPVVYATEPTAYTDQVARHLYPSVVGNDRIPRWSQTRPQWVHDPGHVKTSLGTDPFAYMETYNTRSLIEALGEYPGHGSQEMILFDAPPDFKPKGFLARAKLVNLGGVEIDGPARDHEGLLQMDLGTQADLDRALAERSWVIVSGDVKALNTARRLGYDPIKVGPDSHLIFGPTAEDVQKWAPNASRILSSSGELPLRELKTPVESVVDIVRGNPDGFTFDLQSNRMVDSGVAVAEAGGSLRVRPEDLTEELIEGYIDEHAARLSRPGMNLGGWLDGETGEYVLDVTRVHPKGTSPDTIQHHMVANNQKAAFDLDTFDEVQNQKFDPDMLEVDTEEFEMPTGDGDLVRFAPEMPKRYVGVERSVRQASRFAMPIDRDRVSAIDLIAQDLEHRGAGNLVLHTTRTEVPGFGKAREFTYTDGIRTIVSRHRDIRFGDPNSVPVFVRNNENMPTGPPPKVDVPVIDMPDDGAVLNNSVRLHGSKDLKPTSWEVDGLTWSMNAVEDGPITRSGSKWTIDTEDASDLAPFVQQAEVLRAAGVEAGSIELKTAQGRLKMYPPTDAGKFPDAPPITRTKWGGAPVKASRNLSDDDIFVGAYRFSPRGKVYSKRSGKMVDFRLDQGTIDSVTRGMEAFLEKHELEASVYRLPGIEIAQLTPDALAWSLPEAGAPVQLNSLYWSNPAKLRGIVRDSQLEGYLLPGIDDPLAGIVAHELGHVLHHAAKMQGGLKLDPEVNRLIRGVVQRTVGGPKGIERALSGRASFDIDELVAEATAQVLLNPRASPFARQVYSTVTFEFERAYKYRGPLWRTA